MLNFLLRFLFGKPPQVTFTSDGKVSHQHPDKYWEDWKNRFSQNASYKWTNHSGRTQGSFYR